MNIKEQLLWLWSVMVFGPANKRLWELSANYDGITQFTSDLFRLKVSDLREDEKKAAKAITAAQVRELYEKITASGIGMTCYGAEDYPVMLSGVANPPAVLFYKGDIRLLNDRAVLAVIGTRDPSEYTERVCKSFCRGVSERGVLIATGMAEGVDALALEACMDSGRAVVGVSAKSLGEFSSDDEKALFERICEKGVVVTEQCEAFRHSPVSFKNRNRITIGISRAALFAECSAQSRGLDNYAKALAQGKQIYVIPPHDLFDRRYSGQSHMIRNGCRPVFTPADIFRTFDSDEPMLADSEDVYIRPADDFIVRPKRRKGTKSKAKAQEQAAAEPAGVSELAQALGVPEPQGDKGTICKVLEGGELLADEIAAKTGLDIDSVLETLTDLELDGFVVSLSGKRFGLDVKAVK